VFLALYGDLVAEALRVALRVLEKEDEGMRNNRAARRPVLYGLTPLRVRGIERVALPAD
jgi:hypothetical protein